MKQRVRSILWDVFSIGLLGLNSFVMLLYRDDIEAPMKYVVSAGALAYVIILLLETILLRRDPRRLKTVYRTRKVFKVIYALIYMTALMIRIISVLQSKETGYIRVTAWYGFLFLFAGLWGFSFRWLPKLGERSKPFLKAIRDHIAKKHQRKFN